MSNREEAVRTPIAHYRSVPASYREGAVPIPVPKNPSTPVAKSSRRSATYQRLYTGPPVDWVEEAVATPPPFSKVSNGTPSSRSKTAGKPSNHTPLSTSKPISVQKPTSIPLSALSQGPHPHEPVESLAAARLELIIPLPFIASASDARHNVILPPSAPKPAPTRYTILFDAAHELIMHQSIVNGTARSARQKMQLEELTRISHRQAKFILDLEAENAKLRRLAVKRGLEVPNAAQRSVESSTAATSTKKDKKRKRDKQKKEKQESVAYVDGLGNKVEGGEQEKQREEREKKMLKVRKQRESLLEDDDEDE